MEPDVSRRDEDEDEDEDEEIAKEGLTALQALEDLHFDGTLEIDFVKGGASRIR